MAGNLSVTREYNRIFSLMRDEAQGVIFDNASARTPTLFRMKDLGAIQVVGGKPHLRFTILKELPTTSGYTDLGTITPVRPDPFTSAVYEWKQLETPVLVSGLDMIKTGDDGIEDLLANFLEAAEISQRDAIGGSTLGIFSDADETDLTKITGLQNHLGSSATTGTVGNLSRATLTAWRHQVVDISNDFSANGLNALDQGFDQASYFDEIPDTVVFTKTALRLYKRNTTRTFQMNLPLDMSTSDKAMLDMGFPNIMVNGAVAFSDDGCPANRIFGLNLKKYIRLIVREGRESEIADFVKPQNQDSLATHVFWAGNLINTNLSRNFVLLNGDTN